MVKILHTADLHLGAPFSGLPLRERERFRLLQEEALRKMVEYASREGVALFLVAGDLFDSWDIPSATVDHVFSCLQSLGCPVVIAPGNHDPLTARSPYLTRELPENVFVFRSESLSSFSFPDVGIDVFGYGFTGPTLDRSPIESLDDNFAIDDRLSILLLHGDLDSPLSRYGSIRSSDLSRSGADYVALGHVHNAKDELLSFGTVAGAYAGFPFGRSFDERGFGSVRVITLTEKDDGSSPILSSERIRVSDSRFEVLDTDVTGCGSDDETAELLRHFFKKNALGNETALRLSLSGEVSPRYTPDVNALTARLSLDGAPSPLFLSDHTLPILDGGYLEEDLTLRGELYRTLKPKMLTGSDEERKDAALALRIGLAALDGRPILS